MKTFLTSPNASSEVVDVKNPVFDLLLKDEELEASAAKAQADMEHMCRRMASLDEQHPAYEPLSEELGSSLEVMEVDSSLAYRAAVQAIDKLNNREFLNSTQWLITLALFAGGLASGPTPPGFAGVGGAGAIIGAGAWDGLEDALAVRREIERSLELTASISAARVCFDETWSRLVEDEQPEHNLEV